MIRLYSGSGSHEVQVLGKVVPDAATVTLNRFLLSLCLAILTSCAACMRLIPEKPMIFTGNPEKEFLGIPWSCGVEVLQALLDKSPYPTTFMKVDATSPVSTYQYKGNHHLPRAKYTTFTFLHGKLRNIDVLFFNESAHLAQNEFGVLRKRMKQELDNKMVGISIEVDLLNGPRQFWGKKGQMSFQLTYGGDLVDRSDKLVVLSADSH